MTEQSIIDPSRQRKSLWRRIIIAIVAPVALIGGVCFCYAAYLSIQAEETFHACNLTVELVDQYVSENGGKWPESWDDLKRIRRPKNNWPDDAGNVVKRVAIDFSADPDKLATLSVEEFDAIKPIGPNYGISEGRVSSLLTTLQLMRNRRAITESE